MVLSPCLQQIVLQCVTEECTKTRNSLRMNNWKVAAGAADKVPPGYARSLFIPCFLYLSHSNSSLWILSTLWRCTVQCSGEKLQVAYFWQWEYVNSQFCDVLLVFSCWRHIFWFPSVRPSLYEWTKLVQHMNRFGSVGELTQFCVKIIQ